MNENSVASEGLSQTGSSGAGSWEQDALYQKGKIVARVVGTDVDLGSKEVRFDEIVSSDDLVLADECEFQKYTIFIRKIAFATREDHREGRQGRTLAGCTAEILSHLEQ